MDKEPRLALCYGCKKECQLKLDDGFFDSKCCSGVIVDQYGNDWSQYELEILFAELEEHNY